MTACKFVSAAVAGFLVTTSASFAQNLTLSDCAGVVRAVERLSPEGTGAVHVSVEDTQALTPITLRELLTGEVRHATATKGAASFNSVPAGDWQVCADTSATLSRLSIIAAPRASQGEGIAAVGAASAAVIAGVVAFNSEGTSGNAQGASVGLQANSAASLETVPVATTDEGVLSPSSSHAGSSNCALTASGAQVCFNDEDVDTLSPFS